MGKNKTQETKKKQENLQNLLQDKTLFENKGPKSTFGMFQGLCRLVNTPLECSMGCSTSWTGRSRSRSSTDHLQIIYRSSTHHLQIINRSSTDTGNLQIIYRSSTDNVKIIYRSSADHLQIIQILAYSYELLCRRICIAQIQPREHVLVTDHEGYTAPTRRQELRRSYRSEMYLPILTDVDHQVGIDRTDDLSQVCNVPRTLQPTGTNTKTSISQYEHIMP